MKRRRIYSYVHPDARRMDIHITEELKKIKKAGIPPSQAYNLAWTSYRMGKKHSITKYKSYKKQYNTAKQEVW